jgi:hypothetical protein
LAALRLILNQCVVATSPLFVPLDQDWAQQQTLDSCKRARTSPLSGIKFRSAFLPGALSSQISHRVRTSCHGTHEPDRTTFHPALRTGAYDYSRGPSSESRSRRRMMARVWDAFGSCDHGETLTDGTGGLVTRSLRPRPMSRGRRRTVVSYWLRRSRRGSGEG